MDKTESVLHSCRNCILRKDNADGSKWSCKTGMPVVVVEDIAWHPIGEAEQWVCESYTNCSECLDCKTGGGWWTCKGTGRIINRVGESFVLPNWCPGVKLK